MDTAKRFLPQQRRASVAQAYKRTCVALARTSRGTSDLANVKAGNSSAPGNAAVSIDSADEEDGDVSVAAAEDMPLEVLGVILRALDPVALARAGAVCR
jgi:hypothetical protein